MSSVVIWEDKATGVTVSWNKQAPHTVFVPLRIDEHGICDGRTTEWRGENAAMRAGKAAAKERLEEMKLEDPKNKRFRIMPDGESSMADAEVHNRDWFTSDRLDDAMFAEIDALPVTGTCRTTFGGKMVIVQRVE
jgi:hypothetical protein